MQNNKLRNIAIIAHEYIKKDISVLDKIKNSNSLENRLECSIDESLYEEIKKVIEK